MAAIHVSASCRSIPFDIELMIWRGRTNADGAWLYEASHFHVAAALYSSGGLTRKDASTATPPMERESVTNWCCSLPALQPPFANIIGQIFSSSSQVIRSYMVATSYAYSYMGGTNNCWVRCMITDDHTTFQEEKICVKNGGMSRIKHRLLVGWLAKTMTL